MYLYSQGKGLTGTVFLILLTGFGEEPSVETGNFEDIHILSTGNPGMGFRL